MAARKPPEHREHRFAGFFFGRTCFADPLIVADPDIAKTLSLEPQNFPFTGGYVYAEGWVPLNEALGIPSSCLFSIRGGQGVGAYVFLDGSGQVNIGGKYLFGLSGELLCIISLQGELRAIGGVVLGGNPELVMRGVGKVSAEVGFCPFCVSFGKEVGMTIRSGGSAGAAQYEFDY